MWECIDFYPMSKTSANGLDTSENGADVKHVMKTSLDDDRNDYYTNIGIEVDELLGCFFLSDMQTGKLLQENHKEDGHTKTITSLVKSPDGSHFLTGSLDKSAKLWDTRTLTLIKTYRTESPVNAVAMSPLLNHVVLGGGQDAINVTTTDHRAGKFEAKFYDKILQEEIGGVKGHFGPINALAFNPDGKSFSSGGEDGYIRLHHFDHDYFNIKI